jgi:hypothetical protein
MREVKDCCDDNGKPTGTRSCETETWPLGVGRFFDFWRKRYTFERSSSDKPLSCTRVGTAHDHIDAPAKGTLHCGQAKVHNFAEFRPRAFAFHAGIGMLSQIREFVVTEVTACR